MGGLTSCSNPANEQKKTTLKQKLTEHNIKSASGNGQTSAIVIIPRTGCSGCIGMADYFFKMEGAGNNRIQFIFTKIGSMKELHSKIDPTLLSSSNVLIDNEGAFGFGILDSIYPTIAFFDNDKISRIENLSPSNKNLLEDIRSHLSEE